MLHNSGCRPYTKASVVVFSARETAHKTSEAVYSIHSEQAFRDLFFRVRRLASVSIAHCVLSLSVAFNLLRNMKIFHAQLLFQNGERENHSFILVLPEIA